jgi:hypothetical protein
MCARLTESNIPWQVESQKKVRILGLLCQIFRPSGPRSVCEGYLNIYKVAFFRF